MLYALAFVNKQTGSLQVSNFRHCIFFLETYAISFPISGVFLGILEHTRPQLGASSSYSPRLKVFSLVLVDSALLVSFSLQIMWNNFSFVIFANYFWKFSYLTFAKQVWICFCVHFRRTLIFVHFPITAILLRVCCLGFRPSPDISPLCYIWKLIFLSNIAISAVSG